MYCKEEKTSMFRISCVRTSKMKKNYTKALFESMKFFL